jgi:hypothetical protein
MLEFGCLEVVPRDLSSLFLAPTHPFSSSSPTRVTLLVLDGSYYVVASVGVNT